MKQWITGIVAASLLSTLALTLCPGGRVRTVLRMMCGIVCALAIASPVLKADVDSLAAGMAAYRQQAQKIAEDTEEEEKMLERTYIEERCAAYILAKAAEIGADAEAAAVLARWDDSALIWYPWEATVTGAYHGRLSELIEAELGIPAERQTWTANE